MKNWIRWKGLMFFFCFVLFFSVVWFVFAPLFVEKVIEKYGTRIVGAKVELDDANLSFLSPGINLKRLQITNPDEPMTNAVEVADIGFTIDGLNLLKRKIIINEMNLDQVQINTPRKKSGAVRKKAVPISKDSTSEDLNKSKKKTVTAPSFKIPDVNEIIEKENLVSLEMIKDLDKDIKAEEVKWKHTLNEIPDKKRFNEYKKRIEKIKSSKKGGVSSILEGVGEASELREDIKKDLIQIEDMRKGFKADLASLKKRMDDIKKAPMADVRRLKDKYSISPKGIGNLSRLFLGPKIGEWTERALSWYKKAEPFLKRGEKDEKTRHKTVKPLRGKGVNVVYKEDSPLPDFLIRNANASLILKSGNMAGKINNITTAQDITRVPLTFIFSGDKLKEIQSVQIKGSLDHIVPVKSKDTMTVHIKGYHLHDITLSDQQKMPVDFKEGFMSLKLNSELTGEAVQVKAVANFESVNFAMKEKKSDSFFAQTLYSALSDINRFSLMVDVAGTLDNYKTDISSDLDQIMKRAMEDLVKKEREGLEKKLKSAVYAKLKKSSDDLNSNFDRLSLIENKLASRLDLGNDLSGSLLKKDNSKKFELPF